MAVKKIRVLGKELGRFSLSDLESILLNNPEVLKINEKSEDLSFWRDFESNHDDDRGEYLVVYEYKLETDEQYQKRLEIDKESKKRKKKEKEKEELELLAKLKAKYEQGDKTPHPAKPGSSALDPLKTNG